MNKKQVGEFIDIGNGPQEVRHVARARYGLQYELARPDGRTPLQTVSHDYIERLYRLAAKNEGKIGIREIVEAAIRGGATVLPAADRSDVGGTDGR